MAAGDMAPVLNMAQNTEVNLAAYPGNQAMGSSVCLDTTSDEYENVLDIPVKSEPYFTIDEDASGMDYLYQSSLEGSDLNPEMVTHEEIGRRFIRRERNKVAASKCRQKRKEHVRNLVQASDQLEMQNSSLQNQITKLHDEIKQLEFMLDSHSCSRHMAGNHSSGCDKVPDAS